LPRSARRITGWSNVVLLAGLAMAGIVFADYDQWGRAAITYACFAFFLYFLGTAAYRLTVKGDGRIEAHSLLGLRPIDLRNGFVVKQGWFGPTIVVLRASGKRLRINGGLGGSSAIEEWLRGAANR
jgi:hypothetical protein